MLLRSVLQSRALMLIGAAIAVAVPVLTLPQLPQVTLWPALVGLAPWMIGKYVLCPLRWRVLTGRGLSRWWHLRAHAEAELLGLFTPGHVGADVWRVRRLVRSGLGGPDALASVGLDRMAGAVGLAAFVLFAGTTLPLRQMLIAFAFAAVVGTAALVLRRMRPELLPSRPLPGPKAIAHALALSAGYQLTIAALLLGTVAATGYQLSPLALLGAFGASQLAGAIPGPNGASPRDGALVLGLVALGVPWLAAAGAVTLKAALAWLPALALGGVSLILTRNAFKSSGAIAARIQEHAPRGLRTAENAG